MVDTSAVMRRVKQVPIIVLNVIREAQEDVDNVYARFKDIEQKCAIL